MGVSMLKFTICFNEIIHLTFCGKAANVHIRECQGNVVWAELFCQEL
jgi:hypothetical protein